MQQPPAPSDPRPPLPYQEWNIENHNDGVALFGVEDVFKRDPAAGSSGWGVSSGRFGIQFEQWTLAGAPNHPVYCSMPTFIRYDQPFPRGTNRRENAASWIMDSMRHGGWH
jgi:hypothetical protein